MTDLLVENSFWLTFSFF